MKLEESRKLLFSDTLVPDIFITEYLPVLDGLSVKIYVYLLLAVRSSRQATEADLARRMGVEIEQIRIALTELANLKLISISDKSLEISDLKVQEIERNYRPKTSSTPLEMMAQPSLFSKREKLISDIAKTFFQGIMSPNWYSEIDSWFDRYHFEPEVIYALFQECSRRNKLHSRAYISKVAEAWSAKKIITYQDLNDYFLSYEKINKLTRKIGRKLRKSMTEYDEEYVVKWVEKMGFEFDIIELALRKTVKTAQPNLAYVDKILQEWFSHQLNDVASINAYEQAKAARLSAARTDNHTGSRKPSNVGNFSQRSYDDDFFKDFYEPVEKRISETSPEDEK